MPGMISSWLGSPNLSVDFSLSLSLSLYQPWGNVSCIEAGNLLYVFPNRLRESGRKTFIVTNSGYEYTQVSAVIQRDIAEVWYSCPSLPVGLWCRSPRTFCVGSAGTVDFHRHCVCPLYPGARGLGTRLVCPLVHTMLSMYMYILLELCNGRVHVGVA